MRPVRGPFEVVITTNSGYPLDRNLYQTVKGMAAAATVAADGGTIICAAECRDGVPDDSAYARLLHRGSSIDEVARDLLAAGHAVPDGWQVQVQARVQAKANVLLHSALSASAVRAAHLGPIDDVGGALVKLVERRPDARICVLPEGPQTIPWLAES